MSFLIVTPKLVASVHFIEQFFGEYLEIFRKHREFRLLLENLVGKVYLDGTPLDGKSGYLLIAALFHVQEMQYGEDGNQPIVYHDIVVYDQDYPVVIQPSLEVLDEAAMSKFDKKFLKLDEEEQDGIISNVAGRNLFSLATYLDEILSEL